ncbi:hypothetical protein [Wenyingzhuangia sp. IMCC45574]
MELKKIHNHPKKQEDALFDQKNRERHQNDFGFEVPADFFKNSKNAILEETIRSNRKQRVIKLIRLSTTVAAAIVLFFTVKNTTITTTQVALNDAESNMMINSLIVNENKLDKISDTYMLGALYPNEDLLN